MQPDASGHSDNFESQEQADTAWAQLAGHEVAATWVEPVAAPSEPAAVAAPTGPDEADPAASYWQGTAKQRSGGEPAPAASAAGPDKLGEHRLVTYENGARCWQCRRCDATQTLDNTTCLTCGKSLFSSEQAAPVAVHGSPDLALVWSLIPGGGQWYLGLRAQGAARCATVLLAFLAAVSFPPTNAMGAMRWVMLAAGFAIWAVSAYDARLAAIGSADDALLGGRRLMWVTAGILGLLVASVFIALAMGALTNGPSS